MARGILTPGRATTSDPAEQTTQTSLSRLPTSSVALYQKLLTFWTAEVDKYSAQLDALLASPVESYTFAGGQGTQSAKRRDLEQAQRGLEHAIAQQLYFWRKLYGYNNVNMALRRR